MRRYTAAEMLILVILFVVMPTPPMAYAGNLSEKQTVLRSASELDYPPFAIVQPDGTAGGFSVDLLKAVTEAVGLSVTFKVGPWNEIKQELADRVLDVLPLVSYSEERDQVYDFSTAYLRMNGTVFIREGNTEIKSLADLHNKEVLVMQGDTAHEYALREKLSDTIITTPSYEEAFKLLAAGKHDAIVVQQIVGLQIINKLNLTNIVPVEQKAISSLKPMALKLEGFEQKFCFAVPEGDKQLLAQLNEGLAIISLNGTYNLLYEQWFAPILPKPQVPFSELVKQLLFTIVPLLLFGMLFGLWYLRRLVTYRTQYLQLEIHQRKQVEKKLQESHDLLANLARLVPGVIYQYRLYPDGRSAFPYASPGMNTIYEVTPEEVREDATPVFGRLHPNDFDNVASSIQESARTLETFYCEFRVVLPKQGLRWRWSQAQPERMADGGTLWYGIISDITERKEAEEERKVLQVHLQQAQKMEAIGTLAGGIAHDFNNILGAILGYAELAQEDSPAGSSVRVDVDQVVRASHRAKDLVKQILAFSRQTETEHIPLQPAVIVKEAVKMLRSSLPTTIDLQQDIDEQAGLILADPTQIHQVLVNLCTNAFHAMEETGGILIFSLKRTFLTQEDLNCEPGVQPGAFVQLSIADTGAGIAPEIQGKMFDPYYTTKEVGKGTGMGLAIIHGIVKSYKGFVTCHSGPGKGTVFHVYLPVISEPTVLEVESPPLQPLHLGNERILFIDDEDILAEMGKIMLERLGYLVTVRKNSLEALNTFQNQPEQFDLVITDQTMPGMTGSDLARRMLQIRPEMPIILCTGYSSLISKDKAKSLGIKGFVLKPLAKKDIAAISSYHRDLLYGSQGRIVYEKNLPYVYQGG